MKETFIFVREDGRVFQIVGNLLPEDFEHAKQGLQTIIRLTDRFSFGREGIWSPVPTGAVAPQDPSDPASPAYHAPHFS